MQKINAEEISMKLTKLLDELSVLGVHSVILASFAGDDQKTVFGMETNTSETIVAALLHAGCQRVEHMRSCQ